MKLYTNSILYIYIFLIVFFPSFFGYTSLGAGQLIYLFFILLLYVVFVILFPLQKITSKIYSISLIFLLQSISYLLTLTFSVINRNLIIRDFFEPIRPLLYYAFFLTPILLHYKNIKVVTFLQRILIWSSALDIIKFLPFVYPIICLYNPFEFNAINYIRFSGTFGFCYNFGFLMIFVFLYYLTQKEKNKENYIYITVSTIIIFLTGSRSIYAAYFFVLFIYYMFFIKGFYKKFMYIMFSFIFFTALYLISEQIDSPILNATVAYVERLVDTIFGTGSDGSLDTRQNQWSLALSYFSENYLLGIGPMKNSNEPIEMMYGYYISSWGILGTSIYIIQIIYFIINTIKCINHNSIKGNELAFSKANLLWLLSISLVGMSSPITDQVRVSNIFYLIQGIQFIILYKHNENNNQNNN